MPSIGKNFSWRASNPSTSRNLPVNELHLWHGPLALSEQQGQQAVSWLNARQLDRYQRRTGESAKYAYLASRFYLYQLLAAYSKCSPETIHLDYNRWNKPGLNLSGQAIEFNFTDTTNAEVPIGVIALCQQHALGVDIEAVNRPGALDKIAQRRFSQAEYQYVVADGQLNSHRFAAVWTCKEAYGKAIGKGINYVMQDIDLYHEGRNELDFYVKHKPFRLHQFAIADTHVGALVHASHEPLNIKTFSWENAPSMVG